MSVGRGGSCVLPEMFGGGGGGGGVWGGVERERGMSMGERVFDGPGTIQEKYYTQNQRKSWLLFFTI